jgi:superfamily II DNA or RNA helicase
MSDTPAPAVDFAEVTRIQERAVGDAITALAKSNAVLVEAPTGSGKTRINARLIAELTKELGRKPKILNLQHREMLAVQGEAALHRWAPEAGLSTSFAMDGTLDQSGDCVYATVQTVAARKDELQKYDVVTIDEAHHASDSKSGDYKEALDALTAKNPDLKLVAVTATPSRPDGRGLSHHLKDAGRVTIGWAELERAGQIKLPHTKELRVSAKDGGSVNQVAAKHYKPGTEANSDGLTKAIRNARSADFHEEMADAWERYSGGRRTIAYHSTIDGARSFADEMKSRGHNVDVVDSKAGKEHNVDVLDRYGRGELDMIVSVKMIDEGLDVPATRCVLILRETTSETEYHQMVGRALRTGEDPELQQVQPLVLDGGASTMIHGAVERRSAIIDYYQKLERGEIATERKAEIAPSVGENSETYTPWRKMKDQPIVLALSDGEGVIFAIESRDATGEPRYSLAESQTVKGRRQMTFMKDENGKPLNGIDGTRLHNIEAERMIPSRATLLRMEATKSATGRTLIDERITEAGEAHMGMIMHMAKLNGAGMGR